MNKTAIRKFAEWAREKLISDITYRAGMLGITENGIAEKLPQSTNDLHFFDIGTKNYAEVSGKEIKQREALVSAIHTREHSFKNYKEAFDNVVEEVAYTWFNRLIAIRFMEVNEYLPSGVRVLSSENKAKLEPDFVTTPFDTDLEFTPYEQDCVIQLKDENKLDELFRMLFIKQCNKLNEILPELFEKTDDFSELLLTISFTDKDGIVYRLTHDIDESDFDIRDESSTSGQVEIIGWMYQYYISEQKDKLINARTKYKGENIPFVTQLFTPDWIVRYMVDNSLGMYWIERNPESKLVEKLAYFVTPKDGKINYVDEKVYPTDITFFDPCMGSGHILVYAFDVLMEIYRECGYSDRDAALNIVQNNLFGLDIDRRAYQLTYFSVMMKARNYDRRFFTRNVKPQVFCSNENVECSSIGSLLIIDKIEDKPKEPEELTIFNYDWEKEIDTWNFKRLLTKKYNVVCTNPPYMNASYMPSELKKYVEENYKNYKSDLFSAFIVRTLQLCQENGFIGMLTPYVWMFISSYEKLRDYILSSSSISSMVQLEYNAFEGACVPVCSFVLKKTYKIKNGEYIKLSDFKGIDVQAPKTLEAIKNPNCGYRHTTNQNNFAKIPGKPFVYWISENIYETFSMPSVEDCGEFSYGVFTCNNEKFLRLWHEVNWEKTAYSERNFNDKKWKFLNKGGTARKWYGNLEYVIDYGENGNSIKKYRKENGQSESLPGEALYLKQHISWSLVTSSGLTFRYYPPNMIFDISAPSMFNTNEDKLLSTLAVLNSKIGSFYSSLFNPTMNNTNSDIKRIPYIVPNIIRGTTVKYVQNNISLAKDDWDSFETSWNFIKHPLIRPISSVSEAFSQWENECENRFNQLKESEEELNRIFIDIYGLGNELTPDVEDKDVTLKTNIAYRYKQKKKNKKSDNNEYELEEEIIEPMEVRKKRFLHDTICELISYAVGCMFGRYSLDVDGLAYAGGQWDDSKYITFVPDADNCIPITDEEYFEDDIVGLFCGWLKKVYGEDTLEENLAV
jgi:hypothetical protein